MPSPSIPSGEALLALAREAFPAIVPNIAARFRTARRKLFDEVDYNDTGTDMHAKAHAERVLLFALLLGSMEAPAADQSDCLDALAAAAVFHDARREDDDLDAGHGLRAAQYCRRFHESRGLPVPEAACVITAFHDLDDLIGCGAIAARPLPAWSKTAYLIFKDADALDRYRFGPDQLDAAYLRTASARRLAAFAASLFEQ